MGNNLFSIQGTSGTVNINQWGIPLFIKAKEVRDTVEFIYRQSPSFLYTTNPPIYPSDRVFKIVYSCIDGKWNKSEPIYGEIIKASDEDYKFE